MPAAAARRLLLAGCALDARPAQATTRSVLGVVRKLGFVQVDSISSVERAHHLMMHARLEGYEPRMLSHHAERTRAIFEHWTHDASLIRSDWLPWWSQRFERGRRRHLTSWIRARLGRNWHATARRVTESLEASGPLGVREIHELLRPARSRLKSNGWWEWSPQKAALEYLWRVGEIAVHSRRGFEKVYDLASRVYGVVPAPPSPEAHLEWACAEAMDRLGAATPREIAAYMNAVTPADARRWCERAAQEGRVAPVMLERTGRGPRAGVARPDWRQVSGRPIGSGTPRMLAPFDPLIRDRTRALELFGFDYRFEAFVPSKSRRYGYYTMPVLDGERLVSRLDLASDRDSGTLRVDRGWSERGGATRAAARSARVAAARLASQLGLALDWRARMTQVPQ